MPDYSDETRIAILETKQESQEEWRLKTDQTLAKIGDALQMLARIDMQNEGLTKQVLELRQEQKALVIAWTEQNDALEARVTAIETALPALVTTKNALLEYAKKAFTMAFTAGIAAALLHFGLKVPGL